MEFAEAGPVWAAAGAAFTALLTYLGTRNKSASDLTAAERAALSQDTQAFIDRLLADNEALRERVAALEQELARLRRALSGRLPDPDLIERLADDRGDG